MITVRTAHLDLVLFRGPCEPKDGDLGPLHGPDAALARQFYRFGADPSLGAPFVDDYLWVGIERGPVSVWLDPAQRTVLGSWQIGSTYAERSGPFSALDLVASSGGYYELHRGIAGPCSFTPTNTPPALAGTRAISLTAPSDTVDSCMDSWSITLYLTADDEIAGVALWLGSP